MNESQHPGPIEPELGRLLDDAKQHDAFDAAFDETSAERAFARVEQTARERRLQRYRSLGIRSGVVLVSACLLATVAGSKLLGGGADPAPAVPTTPSAIAPSPPVPPEAEGPSAPATPITTMHVDELPSSAHPVSPRVPAAPARSAGSTLAEEYRLVDGARAKLASKDYAGALRSIHEHRERFPSGQLNQECESLDIQILVETGRIAEARERARSFSVRFPNGLLLPSVVDAIAGGAPDAARP